MKKNNLVAPVLKWVGGKRQLLEPVQNLYKREKRGYNKGKNRR